MSKNLKRGIALAMASVLALSILAGCGGSQPSGNSAGNSVAQTTQSQENQAPGDLSLLVPQYSSDPADVKTETDKRIEKLLNINIIKNVVPGDSLEAKRNVLLASGSIDIIATSLNDFYNFFKSGQIQEINPEKDMPDYWKYVHDNNQWDVVGPTVTRDGKIYGINGMGAPAYPGQDQESHKKNGFTYIRMVIRQDWLDKLGLKAPTTLDELFDVAKAFKDKDPGNIGKNKIIPITSCNGFLWNNLSFAFGAYGVNYNTWYIDNDTVKSYDVSPGMLQALTWLNKAYKADLIDKDFFTQKEPQMLDKVKNGNVGIFSAHWYPMTLGGILDDMEKIKFEKEGKTYNTNDHAQVWPDWTPITAPKGPNGDSGFSTAGVKPVGATWIPKNAAHKDTALKFANFLFTEKAYFLTYWGVEGEDYVMPDPQKGPQPGPKVGNTDYSEYKKNLGLNLGVAGFEIGYRSIAAKYEWACDRQVFATAKTNYGLGGKWLSEYMTDDKWTGAPSASAKLIDAIPDYALSAPSSANLSTKLNALRDEYFAKFVTGAISLDKWDEYVSKWNKEGGDTLVKEYTESYKSNTGK